MKKRQDLDAELLKRWEKTRALGQKRFVWLHGVLQWGGFMFCFSLAVFQFSHYGSVFSAEGNLPFRIVLALLVWAYVGHLYGTSQWRRNEQEYQARQRR